MCANQNCSPAPNMGRVGVGEASDDCLASKRGFPLPYLPQVGGGDFIARFQPASV